MHKICILVKKAAAGEIAPSNMLHDKAGNAKDAFNIASLTRRWWPLAVVMGFLLYGQSNGKKELNDMSAIASVIFFILKFLILNKLLGTKHALPNPYFEYDLPNLHELCVRQGHHQPTRALGRGYQWQRM